jgi:ribonucleoside-diphosphate reductase alpha chain
MTVNLPAEATTPGDVEAVYLQAWRAGCKGITVYRYGTRPGQVLLRIPTDSESLLHGHAEP